jgi:hypothetical protein
MKRFAASGRTTMASQPELSRKEALQIVLELAEQNALDPELYRGEEELEAEAERQSVAIDVVQRIVDEMAE